MTLDEAERLCELVTTVCSEDRPAGVHRLSRLRGYSCQDVDTAAKLLIAHRWALASEHSGSGEREKEMREHDTADLDWHVDWYTRFQVMLPAMFADDELVDRLEQAPAKSDEWYSTLLSIKSAPAHDVPASKAWLSTETPESFATFCRSLDGSDRLYWQTVYTRLGLRHPSAPAKIAIQGGHSSRRSWRAKVRESHERLASIVSTLVYLSSLLMIVF
jgi:hypothetical protein